MDFLEPRVKILNKANLIISEIAARNCYNSFELSDNEEIKSINTLDFNFNDFSDYEEKDDEQSELLDKLAWVHFHRSVLEHINITFVIETQRGVLQEQARHRIQSLSVKSTRYTMRNLLEVFLQSKKEDYPILYFNEKVKALKIFFLKDGDFLDLKIKNLYDQLDYLHNLESIETKGKNIGDRYKSIVDDTWTTVIVSTFNLRSLENYMHLRDSGSAWVEIRKVAQEMKNQLPLKYLRLVDKKYKKG